MKQPTTQPSASPPWFLILGLLGGIAFVVFVVWQSPEPRGRNASSVNVVELTNANWQKEVVESDIPVFVDFTASWCPPCRMFAPTVNSLADRYKGKIKVAKFDVGDQSMNKARDITARYGIKAIPHVLIFKGGERPYHEFRGLTPEDELAEVFDKLLASR